jgi:multidrug resistance protein, MATE family
MAMKDELGLGEKFLYQKSDSDETAEREESLRKRVWEESKKIWRVAGPAIFTRFTSFGINVITQAFIGRTIGSTELAAYALVGTVLSRFVTGILVSLFFLILLVL